MCKALLVVLLVVSKDEFEGARTQLTFFGICAVIVNLMYNFMRQALRALDALITIRVCTQVVAE